MRHHADPSGLSLTRKPCFIAIRQPYTGAHGQKKQAGRHAGNQTAEDAGVAFTVHEYEHSNDGTEGYGLEAAR